MGGLENRSLFFPEIEIKISQFSRYLFDILTKKLNEIWKFFYEENVNTGFSCTQDEVCYNIYIFLIMVIWILKLYKTFHVPFSILKIKFEFGLMYFRVTFLILM